jgi:hypothetical protein
MASKLVNVPLLLLSVEAKIGQKQGFLKVKGPLGSKWKMAKRRGKGGHTL